MVDPFSEAEVCVSKNHIRIFAFAVAATACSSGTKSTEAGGVTTPSPTEQRTAPNRNRDLITQAELSDPGLRAQSILDVIRSLRPQYLAKRGANSHSDDEAGKVHVSIDNGRVAPIEDLQSIHAGSVLEVRYLNPAQAMQKFGGAAREGPVILVRTVK